MLPGTGGTQRLLRLVGKARAFELMASGRLFDFEEAKALGVVTDVVEAADGDAFMAEVRRARARVRPARRAPARRSASSSARCSRAARWPSRKGLALERELQQQLFESEDAREGLAAHLEKRAPAFKGR